MRGDISQLESAPQLKNCTGILPDKFSGIVQRKAESKRAQIVGKRAAIGTQQGAHKKGKKPAKDFWKRHPPYPNRIRFLFAGRPPVWGGIPTTSKFATYFWHCPDISDTKLDTKMTILVNVVGSMYPLPHKNRHNTDHFVSILDPLCRFCVDFVSIFVNNTNTTFIGNQSLNNF